MARGIVPTHQFEAIQQLKKAQSALLVAIMDYTFADKTQIDDEILSTIKTISNATDRLIQLAEMEVLSHGR